MPNLPDDLIRAVCEFLVPADDRRATQWLRIAERRYAEIESIEADDGAIAIDVESVETSIEELKEVQASMSRFLQDCTHYVRVTHLLAKISIQFRRTLVDELDAKQARSEAYEDERNRARRVRKRLEEDYDLGDPHRC